MEPSIEIRLLSYSDRADKVPVLKGGNDASERADVWLTEFKEWVLAQPDGNAIRLIGSLDPSVELTTFLNCIVQGRAVLRMDANRDWKVVTDDGEP